MSKGVTAAAVGGLIVVQQAVPDFAAQFATDGTTPFAMIGLRAALLAAGIALAFLDPTGVLRGEAEAQVDPLPNVAPPAA